MDLLRSDRTRVCSARFGGVGGGGVWFVWLTIEMRDGGCDELEERGEGEKLYYIRPLNKGRERAE